MALDEIDIFAENLSDEELEYLIRKECKPEPGLPPTYSPSIGVDTAIIPTYFGAL